MKPKKPKAKSVCIIKLSPYHYAKWFKTRTVLRRGGLWTFYSKDLCFDDLKYVLPPSTIFVVLPFP